MSTSDQPNPPAKGQFLVYQAEDGQMKIDVRLHGETAWLTQAHMAELFQTTVPNISMHLRNIYAEGELQLEATVQEFLTVRQEGNRQVSRAVDYDRNILTHAGKISHQMATDLAAAEYDLFNRQRIHQADTAGGDFEKAIQQLPPPPKPKKGGRK